MFNLLESDYLCGLGCKEQIALKKAVCTKVKVQGAQDNQTFTRIRKTAEAYNRSISGSERSEVANEQGLRERIIIIPQTENS